MAERRMFHTAVVESDAFLDLPVGAQALYFHLGMHADDDGFVNGPRQIARKLRRPPRELQMLVDSGFLLDFSGIMVLRHWRVANSLKNDRLQLPRYPEIAKQIFITTTKIYEKNRVPGAKNLLLHKKKQMRLSGIHPDSQKKGTEKNRTEKKREEVNGEEVEAEDGFPWGDDFAAAPTIDSDFKFMQGALGKGVVLLTDQQMEELLDKMGLDSFDYYVEKLADFIQTKGAKVKNHYATILRWWQEDKGV